MNEPFKEGDIVWVKTTINKASEPTEDGDQDLVLDTMGYVGDIKNVIKRGDYVERLEKDLFIARECARMYCEKFLRLSSRKLENNNE
jgi:hypothetical protein